MKIKAFRGQFRGVGDIKFFIYRLAMLYSGSAEGGINQENPLIRKKPILCGTGFFIAV